VAAKKKKKRTMKKRRIRQSPSQRVRRKSKKRQRRQRSQGHFAAIRKKARVRRIRSPRQTTSSRSNPTYSRRILQRNKQHLSVIISVYNEQHSIGRVLNEVKKLHPKEIIVVENGSTDRTLEICLSKKVTCFSYPFRVGHDVGRAIGAKEATGDVLLFLDGDIVFSVKQLMPFVRACYRGVDIALNNVNPLYKRSSKLDAVSIAKMFLNRTIGRGRLRYASLTAIPHAMTKKAVELIGPQHLAIPPKAQSIAGMSGLEMKAVHTVDVFTTNKIRHSNTNENNVVEDLIIGDHVEAIQWVQAVTGERGTFTDIIRNRQLINGELVSQTL